MSTGVTKNVTFVLGYKADPGNAQVFRDHAKMAADAFRASDDEVRKSLGNLTDFSKRAAQEIIKEFAAINPKLAEEIAKLPGGFAAVASTMQADIGKGAKQTTEDVAKALKALAQKNNVTLDGLVGMPQVSPEAVLAKIGLGNPSLNLNADAGSLAAQTMAVQKRVFQNRAKLLAQIGRDEKRQHDEAAREESERQDKISAGWRLARQGAIEAAQAAAFYGISGSKSAEDVLQKLLMLKSAMSSLGLLDVYRGLQGAGVVPSTKHLIGRLAPWITPSAWGAADMLGMSLGGAAVAGGAAAAGIGAAGLSVYDQFRFNGGSLFHNLTTAGYRPDTGPAFDDFSREAQKQRKEIEFNRQGRVGTPGRVAQGIYEFDRNYGGDWLMRHFLGVGMPDYFGIDRKSELAKTEGARNERRAESERLAEEDFARRHAMAPHVETMLGLGMSARFNTLGMTDLEARHTQERALQLQLRMATGEHTDATGRLSAGGTEAEMARALQDQLRARERIVGLQKQQLETALQQKVTERDISRALVDGYRDQANAAREAAHAATVEARRQAGGVAYWSNEKTAQFQMAQQAAKSSGGIVPLNLLKYEGAQEYLDSKEGKELDARRKSEDKALKDQHREGVAASVSARAEQEAAQQRGTAGYAESMQRSNQVAGPSGLPEARGEEAVRQARGNLQSLGQLVDDAAEAKRIMTEAGRTAIDIAESFAGILSEIRRRVAELQGGATGMAAEMEKFQSQHVAGMSAARVALADAWGGSEGP